MKQVEMGGAYGTYGVQVRCMHGFGGENRRKEAALKTSIGGRIILEVILKKSVGKIHGTQNTDKLLAVVYAVMKSRIPRNAESFLTN
jgi:hypothetical protein